MRRRSRIAVAENVIRGIIGAPQLVPAGQTIAPPGLARERRIGQPAVLQLGPATVRTSATMELKVVRAEGGTEVIIPHQAAAVGWLISTTMFGGWIADVTTDGVGYIIIGAVAGCGGGMWQWNRWVRQSTRAGSER